MVLYVLAVHALKDHTVIGKTYPHYLHVQYKYGIFTRTFLFHKPLLIQINIIKVNFKIIQFNKITLLYMASKPV